MRRSDIERAITELNVLKGAGRISRTRYNAAFDFLDQHRFYLRKADCDILNPLVTSIEDALREQDKPQIWIVRQEFVPNLRLDEELYYQNE